jgi:hypothetical protein
MNDQLEEWGTWAPKHFKRPWPTRRKAKGWIDSGVLAGKVIGADVYVYANRPFPKKKSAPSAREKALKLLGKKP